MTRSHAWPALCLRRRPGDLEGRDVCAAHAGLRLDAGLRDPAPDLRVPLLVAPRALLPVPALGLGRVHDLQGRKAPGHAGPQLRRADVVPRRRGDRRRRRIHPGRRPRPSVELPAARARPGRRRHARLREAERLATAGELAAGMAHEIRNPLAAIVNATALLTDEAGLTPDERTTTLAAVRIEARRLNRILSDFLQLARPKEARRTPGDIGAVVEHVSALIRDDRSRASRVDVKVAVDPRVPRFAFDRDQMIQVLWNVALNGVEAMNGRGRLSLEVARRDDDVALAVSDTGRGISPEHARRVFEPFYSGKANGNGLGLTIAERIVAAHGGRIEVDSAPGRGTRVTLLFPVEGT